jgi:hypothetical protein
MIPLPEKIVSTLMTATAHHNNPFPVQLAVMVMVAAAAVMVVAVAVVCVPRRLDWVVPTRLLWEAEARAPQTEEEEVVW